jgi:hypothetical protein
VRRSRDRGYKGHRILRRVLDGGRHLGLSRAISFHEGVVTATSAASSRGKAITLRTSKAIAQGDAKALRHSAEEGEATEMSEARSVAGAVGRKRPRSNPTASERRRSGDEARRQRVSSYDPLKRSRVP